MKYNPMKYKHDRSFDSVDVIDDSLIEGQSVHFRKSVPKIAKYALLIVWFYIVMMTFFLLINLSLHHFGWGPSYLYSAYSSLGLVIIQFIYFVVAIGLVVLVALLNERSANKLVGWRVIVIISLISAIALVLTIYDIVIKPESWKLAIPPKLFFLISQAPVGVLFPLGYWMIFERNNPLSSASPEP